MTGQYVPQYTPVSEEDFIGLALAHDAMDKHVPAPNNYYGSHFCSTCHLPLLNGKIEAPIGNCGIRNYNWLDRAMEVGSAEYIERLLAFYMRVKSFVTVEALINRSWNPVTYKPILFKYFLPQHRSVSSDYARVAYWYAMKESKACDESRRYASLDPKWALMYASEVDRGPHAVTRAAACRNAEIATRYAIEIDKAYNVSTLAKSLQSPATALEYMRNIKTPEVTQAVFNAHIAGGLPGDAVKFAKIAGDSPQIRDLILASNDKQALSDYVSGCHSTPDDLVRERVLAIGTADDACEYARVVDQGPRPDTRSKACTDPGAALNYARYVDKCGNDETRNAVIVDDDKAFAYAGIEGPHPLTRTACCADPDTALRYAKQIDNKGCDEIMNAACRWAFTAVEYARAYGGCIATRMAACHDPETAYEYASEVDKFPTPETRNAASHGSYYERRYKEFEKEWEDEHKKKETTV